MLGGGICSHKALGSGSLPLQMLGVTSKQRGCPHCNPPTSTRASPSTAVTAGGKPDTSSYCELEGWELFGKVCVEDRQWETLLALLALLIL